MITHNIIGGKVHSTSLPKVHTKKTVPTKIQGPSKFDEMLQQTMVAENKQLLKGADELKFSKHALKRLFSRDISLEADELKSLKEVVKKLENKGAKESLILMDRKSKNNLAVVVSVRNKTVITAMNSEKLKENIFTNIDSTVVL